MQQGGENSQGQGRVKPSAGDGGKGKTRKEKELEARRMKLLILANTLPILLDSSDQEAHCGPQLFNPNNCYTCNRSLGKSTDTPDKVEASGDKKVETKDDKEGGDNIENLPDSETASQNIIEANSFLAEIQAKLCDKINFMTRLEEKLIAMKVLNDNMESLRQENKDLKSKVSEVTEENRLLKTEMEELERSNRHLRSVTVPDHTHPSQCCKESYDRLQTMLETVIGGSEIKCDNVPLLKTSNQNGLTSESQNHSSERGRMVFSGAGGGMTHPEVGRGWVPFSLILPWPSRMQVVLATVLALLACLVLHLYTPRQRVHPI